MQQLASMSMGDAHMKILGEALSHGDLEKLDEQLTATERREGIDRRESFRSTDEHHNINVGTNIRKKPSKGDAPAGLGTAEDGGAYVENGIEPEVDWDLMDGKCTKES